MVFFVFEIRFLTGEFGGSAGLWPLMRPYGGKSFSESLWAIVAVMLEDGCDGDRLGFIEECGMLHVACKMKVAQTELNETEYQLLFRYAEQHKLTVKEALRIAAQRLVLDDKVYPDDPIFKNIEGPSKPGKKTRWSADHDKILYGKP